MSLDILVNLQILSMTYAGFATINRIWHYICIDLCVSDIKELKHKVWNHLTICTKQKSSEYLHIDV